MTETDPSHKAIAQESAFKAIPACIPDAVEVLLLGLLVEPESQRWHIERALAYLGVDPDLGLASLLDTNKPIDLEASI